MSPLRDTNLQIRAQLRAERDRRERQARALLPVRLIDAIIADLEELHLTGRKRVPDSLDAALARLQAICPPARDRELRSRITIVRLMDELYEVQELLLGARGGVTGLYGADASSGLSEAS